MTISKAIRLDLNMNSYVRRRRNILTSYLKAITKERSNFLLNHLKSRGGVIHFFIDEKKFVADEVANWRNSRVIALSPFEVQSIMQSKNLASIMVYGGIASDGKVMPPHFIKVGLKINTVQYMKFLERVVLAWIIENYDSKHVMFVQDSASAHRAKTVREFLKKQLPFFVRKDIWPSSSPDLNPCDYWLKAKLKRCLLKNVTTRLNH